MTTESPILHILLIPAEGDPHGLLREGPCFSAAPAAVWSNVDTRWDEAPPHTRAIYPDGRARRTLALVLAWNGEPVPEGCMLAILRTCKSLDDWWIEQIRDEYTVSFVESIGGAVAATGAARLVVVLA
jgi:hypothetical protein